MTDSSSPGPQSGAPILEVDDLKTYFYTDAGVVRAVDGVSFKVFPGETLGIVGESGSGKSVTAASIMRLISPPGRIASGSIRFRDVDMATMSNEDVRRIRGSNVAMIFQDPMTSLNPVYRISRQIDEAMLAHGKSAEFASTRSIDLLGRMGVPAPGRAVQSYPHQFSGGMRQRVMIAMGFSNDPSLLIADEPTTALDVTIQAQILDLLRTLNDESGVAIILISHDLGVVAELCDRVAVMYSGLIVEQGDTAALLAHPRHPYTWALVNAMPRLDRDGARRLATIDGTPPDLLDPPPGCRFADRCPFRIAKCAEQPPLIEIAPGHVSACWVTQSGVELPVIDLELRSPTGAGPASPGRERPIIPNADVAVGGTIDSPAATPLLELGDVTKLFPVQAGSFFRQSKALIHAVDGVSLAISRGETLGLVGESGSGKSTLGRLIVRLHEPTSGSIRFDGHDISHLDGGSLRPFRRRIQMVFQDPYSCLNPRMTVGDMLAEPLHVHGLTATASASRARVNELLAMVRLEPRVAKRYPHEFSGGQRQRIGIARSLAVQPEFIVADEPVSSLDVNIQAQVINLLEDLQDELGLTYLFIAHDLSVVKHVSDHVAVMYLGKVVELAPRGELYSDPQHPYTKILISAAPSPTRTKGGPADRIEIRGEPPSPTDPPTGCRFRTRCPIAQEICAIEEPPLIQRGPDRHVACHFPGEL